MSKKQDGKKDGKKGEKPVVHVRHPELGNPDARSRDERVIRNLLVGKQLLPVVAQLSSSDEIRSIVERIAAEGSALSGGAKTALAVPGTVQALGDILTCAVQEGATRNNVLDRLTTTEPKWDAWRSRVADLTGDIGALLGNEEEITKALIARLLPKEEDAVDATVDIALTKLEMSAEVGAEVNMAAKELHGALSVPGRKARFRKMLGDCEGPGIPNAAKAAEGNLWDQMALEELAKEGSFIGMDAVAALRYKAVFDEVFARLWHSRESFAAMEEFFLSMDELSGDPESVARRIAFAMIADEDSQMGCLAARLSEVMENALIRECFTKLGACAPKDVVSWLDGLTIQQQTTAREFLAACDYHCVAGALTKKAAEFRRYEEDARKQVTAVTEVALMHL